MATSEGLRQLQLLCAFPQRRLRLGSTEAAVVMLLVQQRERYRQSGGAEPLCVSLAEMERHMGIPQRQIMRTISRVRTKLLAQSLIIACLHSSPTMGPLGYGLFRVPEVVAETG